MVNGLSPIDSRGPVLSSRDAWQAQGGVPKSSRRVAKNGMELVGDEQVLCDIQNRLQSPNDCLLQQ
jgi:hypothetical protein